MGGSDMLAELEKVRASMVAAWMAERNVSSVCEFAEALAQPYMPPACDAVANVPAESRREPRRGHALVAHGRSHGVALRRRNFRAGRGRRRAGAEREAGAARAAAAAAAEEQAWAELPLP